MVSVHARACMHFGRLGKNLGVDLQVLSTLFKTGSFTSLVLTKRPMLIFYFGRNKSCLNI